MPTQLPLEATVYFGSKLLPIIPDILDVDAKKDFQKQTNIPRVIRDVSKSKNIHRALCEVEMHGHGFYLPVSRCNDMPKGGSIHYERMK
jgi:hypothetical protein